MNNILPITFNTHNRTKCACYCLEHLIRNCVYDGDIHIYICDDRSKPGHLEKIEHTMKDLNFKNYTLVTCNEQHWGYGYTLNTALD